MEDEGALVEALLDAIEARRPRLLAVRHGPDRVLLTKPGTDLDLEAPLAPLLAQVRLNPGRRESLVDRFAVLLLAEFRRVEDPTAIHIDDVVPVLRTTTQLASVQKFLEQHDPTNRLYATPLFGELELCLAVWRNHETELLTSTDARPLGLDDPELALRAFANLRRLLPSVRPRLVDDLPDLSVTRAPLASSSLLLPDLWLKEAQRCRGELLVVVPARDFVISGDSWVNGILYDLPVLASRIQELAPSPLHDQVLKWTPDGFDVY